MQHQDFEVCLKTLSSAAAALVLTCQLWGQSCTPHDGNLPGPPATAPTRCCKQIGPDLILGNINDTTFNASSEIINGVTYDAFAFGTTSCNIGNMNARWDALPSTSHAVIAENLFKYKNSRLEQIGVSWLEHGFEALADNSCGCGCNGQGFNVLGVGCGSPSTASFNGTQSALKPRWYVNAHTGVFPSNEPVAPGSGTTFRRLRVNLSDLEVSSASVRYFAECHIVAPDDAYFDNNDNNASYREASMTQAAPDNYNVAMLGFTQREQPAIHAWKIMDSQVIESPVQVAEPLPTNNGNQSTACQQIFGGPCPVSLNNTSLVIVSSLATFNNGVWHYEYAVENVNCDTSIGSFSTPMPQGAIITNIGFHDVDYHSGDGMNNVTFDGTDWLSFVTGSAIEWSAAQSYAQNPNGNAIRWATMYNFRFDCNLPPSRTLLNGANSLATLGTFKTRGTVSALVYAPDNDCNHNNVGDSIELANGTLHDANSNGVPDECEAQPCPADIAMPHNGHVDVDDLLAIINGWGPCPHPCHAPTCIADIVPNCQVNVDDLLVVINSWGPCQ